MKNVKIKFTGNLKKLPKKGSDGAAAYDVYADIEHTEKLQPTLIYTYRGKNGDSGTGLKAVTIKPKSVVRIDLGFKIQLPKGYEAIITPRSGLALKHMITVVNTPGTIDEDYRGEVGAIMVNHGKEDYVVMHGDRIAQMKINKLDKVNLKEGEINETRRGSGGYGSTGK